MTLLAMSTGALARPNYTYLGLGYIHENISSGNSCKKGGLRLEGSIVVNEHLFAGFEHVDTPSDDWCGSTSTRLSGGLRGDLGSNSSLYALASVIAFDGGNDTDPGVGLELGVRSPLQGIEAQFFVGYDVIDDFNEAYFGAGFNYWLARRLTLNGQLAITDEDTAKFAIGLRLNF